MNKSFIGLDIGTTSVKAVLMDTTGKIMVAAAREYTLETNGNYCEIETELYWINCVTVIKELVQNAPIKITDIDAISFSCQGETLICIDENGTPLRKAIVWLDNRSNAEAKQIWDFFGKEAVNKITGQTEALPFWTANRILWLRKNEPSVFNKVYKYLLVEDYIIYRLTGMFATEQSLNSSTLYFNIYKKEWWQEMLVFLEITDKQLPDVYKSGELISTISKKAANETGLSQNLSVVTGAFDHVAGAIGAGNIHAGMVSETTGTSMAMVVTLDEVIENISINLPMQCHAIEGKYLLLPYAQTAGMMFRWFRDIFCELEITDAVNNNTDAYDLMTALAEEIAPGSEGLLVLPHLMGSGSPEFNVNAKAVFAGMQLGMRKGHFTRAIMESIAYMIKRNLETLETKGIKVKEIRASGGGAKSFLWNQIKSDVANIPIYTLSAQETASIGAAILAGVGCNAFESIEDGCKKTVTIKNSFFPIPQNQPNYETAYHRYKLLSDSLESFWQLFL